MDSNRKTAYGVLLDMETDLSYSNLALNQHIQREKPESAGFVRELVYGVLEKKLYLDHILAAYLRFPGSKLKPGDWVILRMGLYQLLYMDSVPEYAAVNESVALARKYRRGREGLVNGVLRSYLRSKEEAPLPDRETELLQHLSVKYSYEPWMVEMWLEEYGAAFTEDLLEAGNRKPDMSIRFNSLKTSKEALGKQLEDRGYEVLDGRMAGDALRIPRATGLLDEDLYKEGFFSVQDESSMMAVAALDPQPGETILDVCAAPGGKSLYMGERMKNRGLILAGDIYEKKLELLEGEAERLGITCIQTRLWDGTQEDSQMLEKADRVLADVPCSGLGVIRKKPEIKYKKYSRELALLPEKQLSILETSSRYVKPGGVLVYCTCTIAPAENQQVVQAFLRDNPLFEEDSTLQLMPHTNGTNGFYICKMRRR